MVPRLRTRISPHRPDRFSDQTLTRSQSGYGRIVGPMQTLNVGAGRTDAEYKQAEEQRVAGLRADSQADANYFFWAASVAALASGLFPVRFNIFVNVGVFDLLGRYGRPIGQFYPLVAY